MQCCFSIAAAVCFATLFLVVDLGSGTWWLLIFDALQSNMAVVGWSSVWCGVSLILNLTPQLHHIHLPSSNQRLVNIFKVAFTVS